ncbi:cysteine-rich CWC family protein [Vibrio aestuarianus]|uniref:cysteine-rich CWC family protein n=1 Tax=Vibrio aestuarianus TaxID=28171 RepID=UPI00155882BE|nr:cysteine-rich CWC family protein [Vibrio aestuarianus]MDE1223426.1 cysteine-rich CWC family protein [Vibrio aestuarianus]MDE1339986.1 cysteine-rich CWC family protein [Vibrio aestuarianus]MDE1350660.1 cysteine-rich CWC family protein [Vibrio aestuarianus]NGZ13509.1 DUF1289 domain-containing protein [Vibrio aestuarianus]NKZ49657.1 DUF1289 domain-containing protein [Vibrio aestuarianus]
MKTPCIAACKNEGGICSGCHRTMQEIVQWRNFSVQQRDEIMTKLKRDQGTHRCPSCKQSAHCDISEGKTTCWCFELEDRDTSSLDNHAKCLCRHCLTSLPIA